mgnify:CR=1 FL=1
MLGGEVVNTFFMFLPTNVLIGVEHFKTFDALFIFGKVVMLLWVTVVVAVMLSIIMVIGAYFSFKKHEVEN